MRAETIQIRLKEFLAKPAGDFAARPVLADFHGVLGLVGADQDAVALHPKKHKWQQTHPLKSFSIKFQRSPNVELERTRALTRAKTCPFGVED